KVNAALSGLVRGIMDGCPPGGARAVLDDPDVQAIRGGLVAALAVAEGEMERFWGEELCSRADLSVSDFRDFAYWDCYRNLSENELRSLPRRPRLGQGVGEKVSEGLGEGQSIAFVGAGPLPLSAIIMHARANLRITCIDRNPRACHIAQTL